MKKDAITLTLTDLEDIIDEIREFEDVITKVFNEQDLKLVGDTLNEKLEYIRKALTHVQVNQKVQVERMEEMLQTIQKSIG